MLEQILERAEHSSCHHLVLHQNFSEVPGIPNPFCSSFLKSIQNLRDNPRQFHPVGSPIGVYYIVCIVYYFQNIFKTPFSGKGNNFDKLFNFVYTAVYHFGLQFFDFECSSFASLEFPKFAWHHHQTLDP